MNEIYISENNTIEMKYYLRDNLHLSSQSKVRSDYLSQSTISRNKPLIMFLGSDSVCGKSTLLKKMYDNQIFNIFENVNKSNPLHLTSIDIIYLSDRLECNYHILDIHGKINNPYFIKCSNYKSNRLNCIINLASLSHCIVMQITRNEIKKINQLQEWLLSGKRPPKPLTLNSLIDGKKAINIKKFYKQLKVKFFF